MDIKEIPLADAFEKSSSSEEFLNLIIYKVSQEVDKLEDSDTEEDNRKFSRKLKALQFISTLVESKKKIENNESFSAEKAAKTILRHFLAELQKALEELGYTEDDALELFQVLQNRVSDWEVIKKKLDPREAA